MTELCYSSWIPRLPPPFFLFIAMMFSFELGNEYVDTYWIRLACVKQNVRSSKCVTKSVSSFNFPHAWFLACLCCIVLLHVNRTVTKLARSLWCRGLWPHLRFGAVWQNRFQAPVTRLYWPLSSSLPDWLYVKQTETELVCGFLSLRDFNITCVLESQVAARVETHAAP